jgi:hypothetical protein
MLPSVKYFFAVLEAGLQPAGAKRFGQFERA